MRRGDEEDVLPLLTEAANVAFETKELQRIIPAMVALLEYEWITGKKFITDEDVNCAIAMVEQIGNIYDNSEFAYWLFKARKQQIKLNEFYDGYNMYNKTNALKSAVLWRQKGCAMSRRLPYLKDQRKIKKRLLNLFITWAPKPFMKKMKFEMRLSGIKSIPRGIRKSTMANPANLTERELDVLQLLKEGLQNKEIANKLFISPKTVDHHISSIFFKLDVNSRTKAVQEATRMEIIK
jgi:DNA-binding CsgD family transcriptional regulator